MQVVPNPDEAIKCSECGGIASSLIEFDAQLSQETEIVPRYCYECLREAADQLR